MVGAKLTRKRMQALRFSNDQIDAVAKLVELHLRFHGYGSGEWTDSAVRRYVRDAGDQLARLHMLTRADCTTRNQRKADRLRAPTTTSRTRIARLSEEEELAAIRPDLDGNQIMEILGHRPGPRGRRGLPVPARAAARPRPDGRGGGQGRAARVAREPDELSSCPDRTGANASFAQRLVDRVRRRRQARCTAEDRGANMPKRTDAPNHPNRSSVRS